MTWNIRAAHACDIRNRWSERRRLVERVIRHSRCHVIGLQEVQPHQLRAFKGFGVVRGQRYGGFNGPYAPILFDTRDLALRSGGSIRLPHRRTCTRARFDAFVLFNTHLDPREPELVHVEGDFLIGDFNLRDVKIDGFETAEPDGPPGTFHGFTGKVARSLGRIDQILYSDRWRLIEARTVTDVPAASDHFPVIAEFELKNGR